MVQAYARAASAGMPSVQRIKDFGETLPALRKDFGLSPLSRYYHFWTKHLYGHQFRAASGVLERFDSVFGCESPHNQGQSSVGCHSDGFQINPLHVFRGASATSIHSHNKFCTLHGFSLLLLYARSLLHNVRAGVRFPYRVG